MKQYLALTGLHANKV